MDDVTWFIAILVYLDDLVLAGSDLTEVQHMKKLLDDHFKMKDLEDLKFFLGWRLPNPLKATLYINRSIA